MQKPIEEIYDSFLADSDASWEAGITEAAYHALAGALHCAEVLQDEARVKHIKTQADRLRTSIDLQQPAHRLATASAKERGQLSVFATLAGQADAITARLHATRAVSQSRAKRAGAGWPGQDEGGPWPVSKEG